MSKVHLRALDLDGNVIEEDMEEFPAIILQHEFDHLDGILFIDKISRLRRTMPRCIARWQPRAPCMVRGCRALSTARCVPCSAWGMRPLSVRFMRAPKRRKEASRRTACFIPCLPGCWRNGVKLMVLQRRRRFAANRRDALGAHCV